jgi:hypothetical protein
LWLLVGVTAVMMRGWVRWRMLQRTKKRWSLEGYAMCGVKAMFDFDDSVADIFDRDCRPEPWFGRLE